MNLNTLQFWRTRLGIDHSGEGLPMWSLGIDIKQGGVGGTVTLAVERLWTLPGNPTGASCVNREKFLDLCFRGGHFLSPVGKHEVFLRSGSRPLSLFSVSCREAEAQGHRLPTDCPDSAGAVWTGFQGFFDGEGPGGRSHIWREWLCGGNPFFAYHVEVLPQSPKSWRRNMLGPAIKISPGLSFQNPHVFRRQLLTYLCNYFSLSVLIICLAYKSLRTILSTCCYIYFRGCIFLFFSRPINLKEMGI